jgi:hypothetical protein
MPTTTQAVVDGMSPQDAVSASLGRLRAGAPADRVDFGERVAYEFTPAPGRASLSHAIAVADSAAPEGDRGESDGASVSQTLLANLALGRSLSQTLTVVDSVSYFMPSYTWVNPAVAVPGTRDTISLSGVNVDAHLTLRVPDFGDSDGYEPFRVSRTSRGGDIQLYQDPMWPRTEVLDFKFSYLDPSVAADLLDFLKATAGALVILTDHYSRTWTGYILTPAGDVVQEKRTTLTAAFKFQVAPS